MKRIAIMTIGLAAAALCGGCAGQESPAGTESAAETVLETIRTRTSIRAFTDQPVEEEKIEQLLRAAMAAPTAVNSQPWAFVVVRDRAQLERLREAHPYAQMLATAQAAIVVCGDMTKALEGAVQGYWIQDTSAATENILLAAHALGLGAVWTGVYPNPQVLPRVHEVLELPQHVIPLNIIPVGYPAQSPEPKDKWKPENIHYERW